jgi:hypothetical protein
MRGRGPGRKVMRTLRGVIHGKAIELTEEPGWPDGQEVTVTIEPLIRSENAKSGALESLQRAAGSWSDDGVGLDQYLEWNPRQRKTRRPELPE